MQIVSHSFVDGHLQHSVVTNGDRQFIRVARFIDSYAGGLEPIREGDDLPLWLDRVTRHRSEKPVSTQLESLFITMLVKNVDPGSLTGRWAGATVGNDS